MNDSVAILIPKITYLRLEQYYTNNVFNTMNYINKLVQEIISVNHIFFLTQEDGIICNQEQ